MRTFSFHPPLVVCLVAMTLATVVIGAQIPALAGALFTSVPSEDPTLGLLRRFVEGHDKDLEIYQGRFDGRSFFYKPPAPRVKPTPRGNTDPIVKPSEPIPQPAPVRYGGPSIVYALGDEVCFHGNLRLRIGEEASGIKVISTEDLPWSVRLLWSGVEFDVPIFKRYSGGFEAEPTTKRSRIPGGGFVPLEKNEAGGKADGS